MYHPTVVQFRIDSLERKTSLQLKRYELPEVLDRCAAIEKSYDKEKGEWIKKPTREQSDFIRNESLMSLCDFRYWSERYASVKLDGGGMGLFNPWQSQEIVLSRHIAPMELERFEAKQRGERLLGIFLLLHKARQLGMTLLARVLTCHRIIFGKYLNAIGASVDDDMLKELYDRDKLIYDHLPFWMRPTMKFEEKSAHVHFAQDTKIIYQQSNQIAGLGQGRQFDLAHLTECAFWKTPGIITFDFFPTIQSAQLVMLESTANGRGNWWHEFTEDTRLGGHPEWGYVFIPWYACWNDMTKVFKYSLTPPFDWKPSNVTELHARKVKETSAVWTGHTVELSREQLYWYETGRESARKDDALNYFLTSYCATPEESFQHTTKSAFSHEMIERLRFGTSIPETVYEIEYAK